MIIIVIRKLLGSANDVHESLTQLLFFVTATNDDGHSIRLESRWFYRAILMTTQRPGALAYTEPG